MQSTADHLAALRAWDEEKSKPIWGALIDEPKIKINRPRLGAWARRHMCAARGESSLGDNLRDRLAHWRRRSRVVYRVGYVLVKGLNR